MDKFVVRKPKDGDINKGHKRVYDEDDNDSLPSTSSVLVYYIFI